MISQKWLEKVKEILLQEEDFERIILFGSQSRGTSNDKSDVDLLIISEKIQNRFALMRSLRRKLLAIPYDFDIITITPEEFERDSKISGTIARYASQDGKIIYAH